MAKLTPNGLSEKQELFCQKFIENKGNASEAYRQVYSTKNMSENAIGVEAKRLKDNPKISLRISELKGEHRERHNLTIDDLVKELEEARTAALTCETPQSSAAIAATLGKAKLLGIGKLAELEIALKQAELEQAQGENNNDTPTPVSITVEVKDARRHAEPEHTTSEVFKPTE